MPRSLVLFLALLVGGCSSHHYHDEAMSYIPGIHKILINKKLCESEKNCSLAFVSGGAWIIGGSPHGGVNITIYEQQDIVAIGEILAFCAVNHKNHPAVRTSVRIFSSAHLVKPEVVVAELELAAAG